MVQLVLIGINERYEACSSEEVRKTIEALKANYSLDLEHQGQPVTWDALYKSERSILKAIEIDRTMRIDKGQIMASRPPFAVATIVNNKIVRLEFYEGEDRLVMTYDLRSRELQGVDMGRFHVE